MMPWLWSDANLAKNNVNSLTKDTKIQTTKIQQQL